MDPFNVFFPVSGVTTSILWPPLVAMVASFFTSMGGVSGAFLLLPFQMSVLGYTAPSVSATNFVYNVVAIPSGVYRFIKEGRMLWPLVAIVSAGTLPGVVIGYYVRVTCLANPGVFKVFVGSILLLLGLKIVYELMRPDATQKPLGNTPMHVIRVALDKVVYDFMGSKYSFGTPAMFALAFVVGIVGGAYGIGGGAIIAPFCVAVFRLPVYTVAGAALLGTFLTSFIGVIFYSFQGVPPDWPLGILFGAGGFVGIYLGAKAQRYVPQKQIKAVLCALLIFLAIKYMFF